MKALQVAIDGPASAGKSTVAKRVAKRFGYVYCDTGAMYRAVTWAALDRGVAIDDTQAVADLAHQIEIDFKPGDPEQRVFVDGTEVTTAIRQNEINANVSAVAAIPGQGNFAFCSSRCRKRCGSSFPRTKRTSTRCESAP